MTSYKILYKIWATISRPEKLQCDIEIGGQPKKSNKNNKKSKRLQLKEDI